MNQTPTDADAALKAKHRTMWAWGDYPRIAHDLVAPLGPRLVEAVGPSTGHRVLDVGAGTGNAAIAAARNGADVVATDLTPELLEVGERIAQEAGVGLAWQTADAEALPFDDHSFDTVLSSIGVMFAPHHERAAGELTRVCRPGGRIGLLSWTPQGFIGEMFSVMKPYAAAPPPGAQPPPLWGSVDHVVGLLGDHAELQETHTEDLVVDQFESPADFREFFKACYGPTIGVYRNIADDPDRVTALDEELDALAERHWQADGTMRWEYLVLTAVRT
jgi:SAM-dependent methyltransferase